MPANLTLTNPTFGTGKFGQALTGGSATVPLNSGASYTIRAWFKIAAAPSVQGVIVGFDNQGFISVNTSGQLVPAGVSTGYGAVADGNWHLGEWSLDPSTANPTCRLFLDGSLVATYQVAPTVFSPGTAFRVSNFTYGSSTNAFPFTGSVDDVGVFAGVLHTASYTVPSAQLAGTEANLLAAYPLDGNGNNSMPTPVVIDRLNAAVTPAPYAWHDDGTSLNANSTGSYLTLGFTGTSIALNTVALSGLYGYPVVRAFIDNLPHVDVTLASGTSSFALATGLAAGSHTLKLAFVSLDARDDCWGLGSAIKVTGFTLDGGATVSAVPNRGKNAIFFGDSITAGYKINGDGAFDGTQSLPWLLAEQIGAEIGQLGYGGQGYEIAGGGNVPPVPSAYSLYSSGVSRLKNGLLSPQPDEIYDMHGGNPATGQYVTKQSDVATMIANYRAMAPNAIIWMIVEPGGYARAAKTAAVAACGDPKVFLLDAGPGYDVGLGVGGVAVLGAATEQASDGVHLLVRTNARFAAKIAALRQHLAEPRRFTVIGS